MDCAVGMIMETLEEQSVAGDTIIIFTSDNGSFLGAHDLTGKVLKY
ncbi:sulfatase-like hydrolase/transferase [Bacteroidota bacterium]